MSYPVTDCEQCGGRGWYHECTGDVVTYHGVQVREPVEVYCECPAGVRRSKSEDPGEPSP